MSAAFAIDVSSLDATVEGNPSRVRKMFNSARNRAHYTKNQAKHVAHKTADTVNEFLGRHPYLDKAVTVLAYGVGFFALLVAYIVFVFLAIIVAFAILGLIFGI